MRKIQHIVSFSGGKDSTAMLLRMIELNYPIDIVLFADTTLEFPEIYEYIKKIEAHIRIPITIVTAKHTWDDYFYGTYVRGARKGKVRGFPFLTCVCWWMRDCKMIPMTRICKGNITYIGIAKDEEVRTKRKIYSLGIYKFPLVEWGWTETDCAKYLATKGLPHPLYHKFKRTGCWLCPKQPIASLRNLYFHYPDLWAKLKQYEKDSPGGFKPNITLNMLEERFKNEK